MAVVQFPPLPPLPQAVAAPPDDRQRTYTQIIGNLTDALSGQMGATSSSGVETGYRASAVDLGALQDILSAAIVHFDMEQVRARWSEDLFEWMRAALAVCVQRRKAIRFDLEENGVHVTLDTQDDRGYYRYEFDIFPGRR